MDATEQGALFRSRDAGETWGRIDLGDAPASRMFQAVLDPADSGRVYCCARTGQVYESQDGGNAWAKGQVPGEMSRSRHVYCMAHG